MYKTQRLNNQLPNSPLVIDDMTHMANFVYNYYTERVKQMNEYFEVFFFVKFT